MVSSKASLMFLVILVLVFSGGCPSAEADSSPWDIDTWDDRTSTTEQTGGAVLSPEGKNSLSL